MSQEPGSKYYSNGRNFVPTIHNDTYPAIDPTKANLEGRTVFITGASKGIGRSSAISFAKAGASTIVIGARSSLTDVEKAVLDGAASAGRTKPKVIQLKLDISDQSSVEKAAAQLKDEVKGIDILINNAGFLEPWKKVPGSDPKIWWTTYEVNVKGTYLMCRSLLPLVLASEQKSIINITSYGAHGASQGASAYQTSKLAICRFTEFLMSENGEAGLLAWCAHPGGVNTELARGMPQHMMDVLNDTPELGADTFVAWTAKRREWFAGRFLSVAWDLPELEKKEEEVVKGELLKVRLALGGLE